MRLAQRRRGVPDRLGLCIWWDVQNLFSPAVVIQVGFIQEMLAQKVQQGGRRGEIPPLRLALKQQRGAPDGVWTVEFVPHAQQIDFVFSGGEGAGVFIHG
jgi:hypothetical protein